MEAEYGNVLYYRAAEELRPNPSQQCGVEYDVFLEQSVYGANMIQDAGILLQLYVCMATGQVLFHRFFHNASVTEHDVQSMAIGALFVATKVEEEWRSLRDVVNVYYRILHPGEAIIALASPEFSQIRGEIVRAERTLLREVGFDLSVEHPHKFLLNYNKVLHLPKEVTQVAWNFVNDSLRSPDICLRFRPEVVACACIYMATRMMQAPLPREWWTLTDASMLEMEEVSGVLFSLYTMDQAPTNRQLHLSEGDSSDSSNTFGRGDGTPEINGRDGSSTFDEIDRGGRDRDRRDRDLRDRDGRDKDGRDRDGRDRRRGSRSDGRRERDLREQRQDRDRGDRDRRGGREREWRSESGGREWRYERSRGSDRDGDGDRERSRSRGGSRRDEDYRGGRGREEYQERDSSRERDRRGREHGWDRR